MAYQSNAEIGEENEEDDIYKSFFKLYKLNNDYACNASVIDLANCDTIPSNVVQLEAQTSNLPLPECSMREHFKTFDQWKMYTFKDAVPGLFIIPGILLENYRLDWFSYFHDHLPLREDFNLKANITLKEKNNLTNLRWITFGYHHNWDSKVYSLDQPSVVIPERIQDLSNVVSTYLNVNFQPQAGIVNYYNRKSSLCFHTDHSELDHSIPLLSFSLGSSAIFLIGGTSKDSTTPILPIMLRDSDLLILSGDSRLALHAVPRIVVDDDGLRAKGKSTSDKSKIHRINVNIRQVM